MKREWKPGDVTDIDGHRAIRTKAGQWVCQCGDVSAIAGDDARPLVVIDPENREQVHRLSIAFHEARKNIGGNDSAMEAALRSLLAPPRPEEPQGLGAVVEDSTGHCWVRRQQLGAVLSETYRLPWLYGSSARAYKDIDAVRVLSEGIQP